MTHQSVPSALARASASLPKQRVPSSRPPFDVLGTAPTPAAETLQSIASLPIRRPTRHRGRHHLLAVLIDSLAAVVAVVAVGSIDPSLRGHEVLIALAAGSIWPVVVASNRGYQGRSFDLAATEPRRVLAAGTCLVWGMMLGAYVLRITPCPGLLPVLAATIALSVAGRALRPIWLRRGRLRGLNLNRAVLIGSTESVAAAVERLRTDPDHGIAPVGACLSDSDANADFADSGGILVGGSIDLDSVVGATRPDLVLVLPGSGLSGVELRRLAWRLEAISTELVVCAGIIETSPRRITVGSIGHGPLFRIAPAQLSGPARVVKGAFDRLVAAMALVLVGPLMAVLAAMIWCADGGSPLFRQTRVGREGREFQIFKFRTMVVDAEARKAALVEHNEADGVLFKMARDPRTTAVGRVLRRYSLDELPQLINVLRGEMSLVGPRPPLSSEVAGYSADMHRRLLVKPGMSGLWQVSGRSQLSWAQAELLDIRYVENWSLALDVSILVRTFRAVLAGVGAC